MTYLNRTNAEANDEPMDDESMDDTANKSLEHAKPLEKDRKHEQKSGIVEANKGCPNKRTRRGYGKKNKRKINKGIKKVKFSLLGTNANGILGKQDSLDSLLNKFRPNVITTQETKLGKKGMIKLKGYQIFEQVRQGGQGGGLLTAVDHDLHPVLVSSGDDNDIEVLTVQVKVGKNDVRIINAYGPQEDESKDKIYKFWTEVKNEVINAKDKTCLIVIQMDANAKVGKTTIKNDPHETSNNGRILLELVERQNLTIANALDTCKGVITRERKTAINEEKSGIH